MLDLLITMREIALIVAILINITAAQAAIEDTSGGTLAQGFLSVEDNINAFGNLTMVRNGGSLGTAADQVVLSTDGTNFLVDGSQVVQENSDVTFNNVVLNNSLKVGRALDSTCTQFEQGKFRFNPGINKCRVEVCNGLRYVGAEDGRANRKAAIIFATRDPIANGFFGGLEAGDNFCQASANQAGLTGTYKAVLSDNNIDARDRFRVLANDALLVNTNGDAVAQGCSGLWVTGALAPVKFDQFGNDVTLGGTRIVRLWTGTKSDGTSSGNNCNNWTAPGNGNGSGSLGRADVNLGSWIQSTVSSNLCNGPFNQANPAPHLYCVQADANLL